MAVYTHDINFVAPALPYPPQLYYPAYFEVINDILRLYFNQIDEVLRDGTLERNSESMAWFLG
jgi:hypothetical protein